MKKSKEKLEKKTKVKKEGKGFFGLFQKKDKQNKQDTGYTQQQEQVPQPQHQHPDMTQQRPQGMSGMPQPGMPPQGVPGMPQQRPQGVPGMPPQGAQPQRVPGMPPQRPHGVPGMPGYNKPPQTPQPMQMPPGMQPIYTQEQIKEFSDKRKMEQKVFLYTDIPIFERVIDYYNDKPGLIVTGTNIASQLIPMYQEILSEHVIVLLASEHELNHILDFVSFISKVAQLNPNMLNIYLAFTEDVNRDNFVKKYIQGKISGIKIINLKGRASGLTEATLDKVVSTVISNQPAYMPENKIIKLPKIASKKDVVDVDNIYKIENLASLKKMIDEAKVTDPANIKERIDKLEEGIATAKDVTDVNNIIDTLPEIQVLHEYDLLLNEYLLEVQETGSNPADINKLIMEKLEVTGMKEQILSKIFDNIIKLEKINSTKSEDKARKSSEDLLQLLDANKESYESIWEQRLQLTDALETNYGTYKRQAKIVQNAIALRKQVYIEMKDSLKKAIEPVVDTLNDDIANTAYQMTVEYNNLQVQYDRVSEDVTTALAESFNYANELLKSYNIILKLDERVVEGYQQENKMLKANNIKVTKVVDTVLKSKGAVYTIIDSMFCSLISSVVTSNTLVVNFLEKGEMAFDVRLKEVSINNIDTLKWIGRDIANIIHMDCEESMLLSKSVMLFDRLELMARYFDKIIICVNDKTHNGVIVKLRELLSVGYTFTDSEPENLLQANRMNTLMRQPSKEDVPNRIIITNIVNILSTEESIDNIRKLLGTSQEPLQEILVNISKALDSKEDMKTLLGILYDLR